MGQANDVPVVPLYAVSHDPAFTIIDLAAILGKDRVGRVRLLASRRPDAFTMENFLAGQHHAASVTSTPSMASLPLRLLREASPANVFFTGQQPAAVQTKEALHHITNADGPWLLSGDWWDDDAWEREVWECEGDDGLRRLVKHNGTWALDAVIG